jgi:hypothetical protein
MMEKRLRFIICFVGAFRPCFDSRFQPLKLLTEHARMPSFLACRSPSARRRSSSARSSSAVLGFCFASSSAPLSIVLVHSSSYRIDHRFWLEDNTATLNNRLKEVTFLQLKVTSKFGGNGYLSLGLYLHVWHRLFSGECWQSLWNVITLMPHDRIAIFAVDDLEWSPPLRAIT